MSDAIDRHINHIRELTARHGALDTRGTTASINNPAWFRDGRLRDERRELHERLIADMLVTGDRAGGQHAVILAGGPGAGKSWLRENELAGEVDGHVHVDVDDVKASLLVEAQNDGSYEGFLKPREVRRYEAEGERFFPLELSALVHLEAGMIADRARERAIQQSLPIVVDGVLSNADQAVGLGRELEEAGYSIDVVCLDVAPEVSEHQIRQRWRQAYEETLAGGNDLMGGRWVPSSFAQHVLNGPDGRSLPAISAERLAGEVGAVGRYRVYTRAGIDAPTVLTTDLSRVHADTPLIDSEAAQAHQAAFGRAPARAPRRGPSRSEGYER